MRKVLLTALLICIMTAFVAAETSVVLSVDPVTVPAPNQWTWYENGVGDYELAGNTILLTTPPATGVGAAGLWASMALPGDTQDGDVFQFTYSVKVDKFLYWTTDNIKNITRLVIYESAFEVVQERHLIGLQIDEATYQVSYTVNDEVPDNLFLRVEHLSSPNSKPNDYVELRGISCVRIRAEVSE